MESHTFFPADLFLPVMIQILSMLPFMQKGWQLFSCYNAGKMKGGFALGRMYFLRQNHQAG